MAETISVIICTKNRFSELMDAIRSLAEQTRLPDEFIVVDASDDEMLIPDHLDPQRLPFPVAVHHTSPGLTHQRNLGIEKSKGDLLFFFDDDVILDPGYIHAVEKVFREDAGRKIGAVGGRILNSRPGESASGCERINQWIFAAVRFVFMNSRLGNGRFLYSGMPTHPHLLAEGKEIECLSGCCMAFRRQVFTAARFDEHLTGYGQMEDADISKQILDAGYRIYYMATAELEHRVSPMDRLKIGKMAEMTVIHYIYLFRKHWSRNIFRRAACWWALCGLFLLYGRNVPGRQGFMRGIRQAKSSLSSPGSGIGALP